MKHLVTTSMILLTISWSRLAIVPKFCQEHETEDYCWGLFNNKTKQSGDVHNSSNDIKQLTLMQFTKCSCC